MPIATRGQAQARQARPNLELPSQGTEDDAHADQEMEAEEELEEEIEEEEVEYEEEEIQPETFPPPGLKEISSLASWTVSTAKPGNGVAALRSPDTSLFWQSDGPQPHLLSIHFFKLVSIVHMRIYLDFENDESYTPTKIQFLAGMGVHDLQVFAELTFEQPMGWIPVDFSNVGTIQPDDEDDDGQGAANRKKEIDWSKQPVLRAFLVQVKILENHQNGKDTHLRAVQLFARDESFETRKASPKKAVANLPVRAGKKGNTRPVVTNNIKLASWMMEPDLR